ncbi:MAG TPA: LytTR family DNA-binding domain-containing protein [Flavisolibacter sp.]|jgi:DNA-binding LytR/AlgR family response regulator|nr:LytTR family DNA-binding domain-containing protein [Flavisolibacter sp.]
MRFLIVEDEALLAKRLINLLASLLPEATIAGQTKSITDTVQWLKEKEPPDLIFMDIELADGQCFAIFEQCTTDSPIIFTTAYDEYALKAFKLNSIDYLLKPIKEEELAAALQKWKKNTVGAPEHSTASKIEALMQEFRTSSSWAYRSRFLVRHGQKLLPIDTDDIGYFSSKSSLTFLVTRQKQKYFIDYTLDEVEEMLNPKEFFRVNRQFILAQAIVKAVQPWFNGKLKLDVQIPTEEDIVVSRDKASFVKDWLGG